MPGPYTTFDRTTCDVPGRYVQHYYWPHASGMCHLAVWRPSASFQGAPVAIFVKGGLGYNPGWRAMTDNVFPPGKQIQLATAMSARGWVVISIEFPVCGSNAHTDPQDGVPGGAEVRGNYAEIHPLAMWPEQPAYVALAVQHVKTNWSAIADGTKTPFGESLWGAGNSINPDLVHLHGNSWGGTMAMYVALQPDGYYPYDREGWGIMDRYMPRASHRVKSVGCVSPQFDLTQFYVDTGYTTTLGEIYQGDRLQPFMRTASPRKWSTLPVAEKKRSPYWVLREGHAENANLAFFIEYLGAGTDLAEGENLTAADWEPGTVRDDVAGGKAFADPHNGPFQGQPTLTEFQEYGGASADPESPIRQSIVRWADGGGSGNLFGQTAYVNQFFSLMARIGYPVEYTAAP